MASSVTVLFHPAGFINKGDAALIPVIGLTDCKGDVIAASGVSAKTALSAPGEGKSLVTVIAGVNAGWIVAGGDPVAVKPVTGTPRAGYPMKAAESQTFFVNAGDKIAFIEG